MWLTFLRIKIEIVYGDILEPFRNIFTEIHETGFNPISNGYARSRTGKRAGVKLIGFEVLRISIVALCYRIYEICYLPRIRLR